MSSTTSSKGFRMMVPVLLKRGFHAGSSSSTEASASVFANPAWLEETPWSRASRAIVELGGRSDNVLLVVAAVDLTRGQVVNGELALFFSVLVLLLEPPAVVVLELRDRGFSPLDLVAFVPETNGEVPVFFPAPLLADGSLSNAFTCLGRK